MERECCGGWWWHAGQHDLLLGCHISLPQHWAGTDPHPRAPAAAAWAAAAACSGSLQGSACGRRIWPFTLPMALISV